MRRKNKINQAIAVAMASAIFTMPFISTASAMEKSVNIEGNNVLENNQINQKFITLGQQLKLELEGTDVDVDELIKEIQNTDFQDLTPQEIKEIENSTDERSVETALIKKVSAWVVKNASTVSRLLKKIGIDVSSKQLQTAAKAAVALSSSVDDFLFRIVRKVAHPSWTDKQCRTGVTIIRLAIPFL